MNVQRNTLLLIACLVWSVAGINILRIGLIACPPYATPFNALLSLVVFCAFQTLVFGRLVRKHTDRISSYLEERQFFLKFFDAKAFAIITARGRRHPPSGHLPNPCQARPACWRERIG